MPAASSATADLLADPWHAVGDAARRPGRCGLRVLATAAGAAPRALRRILRPQLHGSATARPTTRSSTRGLPAHSHDHVFIGNTSTNAFSTPASLAARRAPPAATRDDLSAVLGADALRRRQGGAAARRHDLLPAPDAAPVQPFPAGSRWSRATPMPSPGRAPRSPSGTAACSRAPSTARCARRPATAVRGRGLPSCKAPTNLELQVNFPDCSNGQATSADHRSHMAYSGPDAARPRIRSRCRRSRSSSATRRSASANVFLSSGGDLLGPRRLHGRVERRALARLVHELPRSLCRLRRRRDRRRWTFLQPARKARVIGR